MFYDKSESWSWQLSLSQSTDNNFKYFPEFTELIRRLKQREGKMATPVEFSCTLETVPLKKSAIK